VTSTLPRIVFSKEELSPAFTAIDARPKPAKIWIAQSPMDATARSRTRTVLRQSAAKALCAMLAPKLRYSNLHGRKSAPTSRLCERAIDNDRNINPGRLLSIRIDGR
jgi:hypothetical protein